MVLGYHYFSRFAHDAKQIYPYDAALAHIPLFEFGFYGVHLFFCVSGFVIAMTLQRTEGMIEFAIRRFARLWPTMLLCASITYLILWRWPMYWPQQPINFLPSLTFLDGHLVWGRISPALQSEWIDGAYWSLFVEVRFYFYAGIIYFLAPRSFSRNMLIFALLAAGAYCAAKLNGSARWAGILHDALIAPYLPWFIGGLAAFEAWRGSKRMSAVLAIAASVMVVCMWALGTPAISPLAAALVAATFVGCLRSQLIRQLLSPRWLTLIGVCSYSVYLLHQYAGLTLIAVISDALQLSGPNSIAVAIVMSVTMIALGHFIYRQWEHPLNSIIVRGYARSSRSLDGSPLSPREDS